ncbi:MAG: ATP-binding cassette domain-containing protein, partial [Pseudonocardiaceae bacterium]
MLLGPNGAGKSTLMSLGSTSRSPWSGRVVLEHGQHQVSAVRKLRRAIGWMPQQSRAVPGLRCREQVAYFGWLKGMSRVQAWQGAEARLADVGLTAAADQRASSLSGGQLRRLGLAQVLVASPR